MNNILEIIIRATDNASQVISKIGQSGFTMSRDMEMACLKVGAALTGIGISAKLAVDNINSAFLSFDNAMTEVKALGSLTEDEFEKIRQKALDLSSTMPIAADDVAKAMYSMVSVGWEYGEMMEAIEPASKLAVAGSADLADTIDAVIAVMDAYGSTGITANEITAIFAKGVGEGKWELNDFMQEMMKNINVASNLGISFQELAAYNVALQPTFTDSTEAGTAFKQMLMNLIEEKNIKAIESFGVQVKNTDGSFRGLIPIITDLDNVLSQHYGEVDKNTKIAEIFGARSVNAFNALARKKDDLPELIERMGDATFIEEQFGVKIESTGAKLEIANNKMNNAKIALGDAMAPATLAAAEGMAKLAGVIERLPGPLQTVAGSALVFGQSLIVIGPLLMALPALMSAIGPATTLAQGAMLGLKAAMAGVSTSSLFVTGTLSTIGVTLGSLLLPIAAVVAAAVLLYAAWKVNFLGIRDITGEVASWVKDRWQGVKDTFASVGEAIAPSVDKLKSALGKLFETIDDVFKKFSGGKSIVDTLKSAFDLLGRIIDAVVRKFGTELSRALTGIIDGLTKLVEWVGKAVEWFGKLADNKVVAFLIGARDKTMDFAGAVMDSLFPAVEKTNDELETTTENLDKTSTGLDKTTDSADKTGKSTSTLTDLMADLGITGTSALDGIAGAAEGVENSLASLTGSLSKALADFAANSKNWNAIMGELKGATGDQLGIYLQMGQFTDEYSEWYALKGYKAQGGKLSKEQEVRLKELTMKADEGILQVLGDSDAVEELSDKAKEALAKYEKEGKFDAGGYTPSHIYSQEEWQNMDANERQAIVDSKSIYGIGSETDYITYYGGKTTDYMDDKYSSWGPDKGSSGGGGSGSSGGGGSGSDDDWQPYDPNDTAPEGMTWIDDGEGGYYAYAAGGGKVKKGGKLTVAEKGWEVVVFPDGTRKLFTEQTEIDVPAGAQVRPGPQTGFLSFDELSRTGTKEGDAELEPLIKTTDARKKSVDQILDEIKGFTELVKKQKESTTTTEKQTNTINKWTANLENRTTGMTNNTLARFTGMGTGMQSRMDTTAEGVTSRFGAMGDRSVKSTGVVKGSLDDFFNFMENRAAGLQKTTGTGCTGPGCGKEEFYTDDSGFSTDTEYNYVPFDWNKLPKPKGWDIRLGLPKLASGGNIIGPGRVIVGDDGPEVLDLNKGATVVPLTGSERDTGGIDTKALAKVLRDNSGVRDVHIHVQNLFGVPDKNSLRPVARIIRNLLNEEGNRRSDRGASVL